MKSKSSFSGRVIEIMKLIPEGRVTTYKEIARVMDSRAYRAVGSAVGNNPYAPAVPCHRVVRSDGTVGNYSCGVVRKIALLKDEGIDVRGKDRHARIKDFDSVLFRF